MQKPTLFSIKTQIALIIAIFLWSSAFVGIRLGLQGYSPGALALLRFLIAAVCMFFVFIRKPRRSQIPPKDLFLLVLFGALGLGGYNVALNYGELTIPSGIAGFMVSQSPLITMVVAVFFLREKFSSQVLLGILISIVGVALISIGESDHFKFDLGLLYMFFATLLNAFYSVLQKPFLRKYHAIDVTVYIIWGAALALLIFLPDLLHDMKHASHAATWAAIYLGIFPAAIAYIAWSYALAAIPASRAVSFLYFMPVIATFLGWLCLGEIPVMLSLAGGFVALFGVWVANHK
jgi:drug/metabolite transporter (DMT)-like permease